MYLLTDSDGWNTSRTVVRQTASTLKASEIHAPMAKALGKLLLRWVELDAERRAADDALVDGNARVTWLDVALDQAVNRFVAQVLADCDGQRTHKTFESIFPDAPSAIIRLALESEVAALTELVPAVEHAGLPKATMALWSAVTAFFPRAKAALEARDAAAMDVARVGLKLRRWKDDANNARRSIEVALDQHAVDAGLPRDYSAAFFPRRARAKKPAVTGAPDRPADAEKKPA